MAESARSNAGAAVLRPNRAEPVPSATHDCYRGLSVTPDRPYPAPDDQVAREVIRIYERYAREVVERFDFCPWASRARREGAAEPHVLLGADPTDFSPSLQAIAAFAARPTLSVGLLIYPRFSMGRLDFEHFVRQLRQ